MKNATEETKTFTWFLSAFHAVIESMPPKEKVKDRLLSLRESANKASELNLRQKESIIARIDNYLNDQYGNTKEGITFRTT